MISESFRRYHLLWVLCAGAACTSSQAKTDVPLSDDVSRPDRPADVSRPSLEPASDQAQDHARPMRCIESWPVFPSTTPKPPLAVKAPAELWRTSIPNGNFIPETAFSGTHLGILTRNEMWILDRQGTITGHLQDTGCFSAASGPVADRDGSFYFVTTMAVKISPEGTMRWFISLDPNISPNFETTTSSRLLLSPDNTLYFSATDGYLYALATADDPMMRVKWMIKVGLSTNYHFPLALGSGVGDMILMEGPNRMATDGTPVEDPWVGSQPMEVWWALPEGLFGGYIDSSVFRGQMFDRCGKPLWAFPQTGPESWYILLRDYDSRYLVSASAYPTAHFYYYSGKGTQLLGPKDAPVWPRVLGADGSIYETRCTESGTDAVLDLVAYSPTLEPLWSLSFTGPCRVTSLVLADDGVLYYTHENGNETEVIAIQTRSPGLASTPFPITGYNNRRTGWLAPE